MLHLLIVPSGIHVSLRRTHIILQLPADPEENRTVRPLLHDKAVRITSKRNLLQFLVDRFHLPLRIPDRLIDLRYEIVHESTLQLLRLLTQPLSGLFDLHMSQIPVLFPVKRDISNAPLIDIQLRKTAVLEENEINTAMKKILNGLSSMGIELRQ